MFHNVNKFVNDVFHFIEKKQSTTPLLFFRVGLGLICIGKLMVLCDCQVDFYGQFGWVQWPITKLSNYTFLPHLGDLSLLVSNILQISIPEAFHFIFYFFYLLCFFLIIGFCTRLASIGCFFLHLAIINTGNSVIYGVDVFTQLSLFYGMLFSLNSTYSIDSLLFRKWFKEKSISAGIMIRMVQFQLCLVYFSTAIEKCLGSQWLNGEAIWRTLMMPIFRNYNFDWIANYPILPLFLGWLVIFIEFGYVFFIWKKGYRIIWLLLIIGLHFNIGLLMGMWFFAAIMIFLSVFAFGKDVIEDLIFYQNKYFSN